MEDNEIKNGEEVLAQMGQKLNESGLVDKYLKDRCVDPLLCPAMVPSNFEPLKPSLESPYEYETLMRHGYEGDEVMIDTWVPVASFIVEHWDVKSYIKAGILRKVDAHTK